MSAMKISVVVATYNRVHYLEKCLRSLEKQSYSKDKYEIIVINDGSTDSTENFLNNFKNQTNKNFKYISHTNKGVAFSRPRLIFSHTVISGIRLRF